MMLYMRALLIAFGYIAVTAALTMFSFALAIWTKLALIPAVVTMFISLPMMIIGMLRLYFGSYDEIPPVAWICIGTMLTAGILFGIGILLN
jgi:hypothetical protein